MAADSDDSIVLCLEVCEWLGNAKRWNWQIASIGWKLGFYASLGKDRYQPMFERHHFSAYRWVVIPKKLHRSICHDLSRNVNMDTINALALQWLIEHKI